MNVFVFLSDSINELDDVEKECQLWDLLNRLYTDSIEFNSINDLNNMELDSHENDQNNEHVFKNEAKLNNRYLSKKILISVMNFIILIII